MDDQSDRRDDKTPREENEGVRIIGAEEAAEAVERGEVAPRLSDEEPRFGDRPNTAPEGARPALRFPLDADSDPSDLIRPAVLGHDPAGDDDPSPSGSVELPHWTDPPTGEVPAVLIGDDEGDDLDAWSSFATSSPTRWRGADDDWDDTGEYTAALSDDDPIGALDTSERPTDEDLFSFDDIDEVASQRTAAASAERARALTGETDLFSGGEDPTLDDFDDIPLFSGGDVAGGGAEAERETIEEAALVRPRRRRPSRGPDTDVARGADPGGGAGRDVPTAVAAGVGIAVVALICFALGSAVVAVLVTLVVALAAVEYFGATQRAGLRPAALLGLIAAITFPLATYWRGEPAVPLILALSTVFAVVWYLVGAGGDSPVLEGVGSTLVGVLWIGLLGSYATLLLRVPDGRGILLAVIITTVFYDIGAFFSGRTFGQRRLSGASPNKTVEGFVGGVAVAAVIGMILGGIGLGTPFHGFGHGLVLGIVVGVAATFGDLCESLVKRDLGVKDMGAIIPGHGGVLDRIDGLLFVLPAAYYLIIGLHWM
ncbi:MAG TPA: phosphatidate cytidylyltransferase [Acidimicrobiales bacterium]|nr:phosphatidate cytidylyltransferase [Acidimicrobiales bacterium]